jgi:ribosomal protein S18 acetylase RimI-like enzyme
VTGVITRAGSRMLVAEADGELVGCCQLESRPERIAYVGMFSVRPDVQGGGVGRAIATEAERIAAETWGAEAMRMTVLRPRAELIAWYERLGYRRTGETAPFPYGDERFGKPKVDDLEFDVLVKPVTPSKTSS